MTSLPPFEPWAAGSWSTKKLPIPDRRRVLAGGTYGGGIYGGGEVERGLEEAWAAGGGESSGSSGPGGSKLPSDAATDSSSAEGDFRSSGSSGSSRKWNDGGADGPEVGSEKGVVTSGVRGTGSGRD